VYTVQTINCFSLPPFLVPKCRLQYFLKIIIGFLELLLGPANLLGKQPVPVLSVQAALFAVKDGGALERRRQRFVADFVFEILTKSDLLAGSVFVAASCFFLLWSSC
jgi:hypothetical protein